LSINRKIFIEKNNQKKFGVSLIMYFQQEN